VEVLTGWIFQSLGVTADGFDMLVDAVCQGLSLLAITRCACFRRYIVNISGTALFISAAMGLGLVVERLYSPVMPNYLGMMVISAMAFAGNFISLALLQKLESKTSNIKAVIICSSKDCLVNLGIILSAVLVWLFDSQVPDLVIGAIVFVLVMRGVKEVFELKREKCPIHDI
jgi:Co/Zn/Cd efflux system component